MLQSTSFEDTAGQGYALKREDLLYMATLGCYTQEKGEHCSGMLSFALSQYSHTCLLITKICLKNQ